MMAGEGFKALADPTRRRILELLRAGDMTAGELRARARAVSRGAFRHQQAIAQSPSGDS